MLCIECVESVTEKVAVEARHGDSIDKYLKV